MVLTEQNYYGQEASRQFFSVSQYKDFMKCEAMAMAKIRGEYQQPVTKALLVGSFVDSYFEGTLKQFMEKNPELFTRKNELKSEFRKANEIIGRVKSDPLFMQFMSGEKQRIMVFTLFGVPWKMKMDSYLPGTCIADLKIVANFKNLPLWPFYLAVATKERVPDLDIFQIPQNTLNHAMDEIGFNIEHFAEVKAGVVPPKYCGKCDYCKSIKGARIRNYNELLDM